MSGTAAEGEAYRQVYIKLFNDEFEAMFARLRAAGMPTTGICGCLASRYAVLAIESGASCEHAVEIIYKAVLRVAEDEREEPAS